MRRRRIVVLVLILLAAVWPATPSPATGSTTQPAPPTGLSATGSQLFSQVAGTIEARDEFGRALAVGDFNGSGFDDLAAAAPSETVGTLLQAGAVSAIYGTATGLSTAGGQIFTQDTPGVPGTAEDSELFGDALATGNPG